MHCSSLLPVAAFIATAAKDSPKLQVAVLIHINELVLALFNSTRRRSSNLFLVTKSLPVNKHTTFLW